MSLYGRIKQLDPEKHQTEILREYIFWKGQNWQDLMIAEECSELAKAAIHRLRVYCNPKSTEEEKHKADKAYVDGLADVHITTRVGIMTLTKNMKDEILVVEKTKIRRMYDKLLEATKDGSLEEGKRQQG